MIASAVAVLIAYHFSLGNLVSGLECGRGPKLASLDSRIIAPPLTAAAEQKLRPNEERDSTAAAPLDSEISSRSAIIPQVQSSQTAAMSQPRRPIRLHSGKASSSVCNRGYDKRHSSPRLYPAPCLAPAEPNSVAGTPLRIPYGNKDVAMKLSARYGSAGWYAPLGVDLSVFGERGWL
jgi:hypothetical protein